MNTNTTSNPTSAPASASDPNAPKKRGRKPGVPNTKQEPPVAASQSFKVQGGQTVIWKLYDVRIVDRFEIGCQKGRSNGAVLAPEVFDFPMMVIEKMAEALRNPTFSHHFQMNEFMVVRSNHENGFTISVLETRSSKNEPKTHRNVKPLPGGTEVTLMSQAEADWLALSIEMIKNDRVLPADPEAQLEAQPEAEDIQIESSEDESDPGELEEQAA